MQKHKEIKRFELYTDGGLVIKFKDGEHTYICRHEMYEIVMEFNKLIEEDE